MGTPSIGNVGKVDRKKVEIASEPYEKLPIAVHQNEFNRAFINLAQKLRIIEVQGKPDPKQIRIDPSRANWLEFPLTGISKPLTYVEIFNSNDPKLIVNATSYINEVCMDSDAISSMNMLISVNKEREAHKLTNFEKIKVQLTPKTGEMGTKTAAAPAPAPQPKAKHIIYKDPVTVDMLSKIQSSDGSSLYRKIVNS